MSGFWLQPIRRIGVPCVPQHPSVGAEIFRRFNLRANFLPCEWPVVKSVVLERLEPGPEARRGQPGAFLCALQGETHNLVRVLHGVAVAGNSEMITRGIEHRRGEVELRRQLLELLADIRVIEVPADVAEDIDCKEDVVGRQPCPRLLEKSRDGVDSILRRVRLGKHEPTRVRKAHVVELNFVEAASPPPPRRRCCSPTPPL